MKKKTIISSSILVLIVAGAAAIFFTGKKEAPINFRTQKAELCELELTVTASGYIQPVTKVDVGTQVSGIVKRIYVDFNSQVEKGQLLAELDKLNLTEQVQQRRASVSDAESNLLYAKQNHDRIAKLYADKAATEAQMEEASNRLSVANNSVTQAKANLNQSLVNLGYADIYSPISGRVLNRAVDEGQTVAASFNTPTLFTIANDLTKMQIEANVDEADIGRVRTGQKAVFEVDTYPGEEFSGTVEQIRLEPTVTSNVVTYTVVITVPNPDEKLYPGMTANVTITTQSPRGICVPAEALYFSPKPEELKGYVIEGVDLKGNKVWTRTETGLKAIPVTVGASDGIRSIVLTGIEENQQIVTGIERMVNNEKGVSIFPGPPGAKK
ncbi:efflux RND transporter periplasmic adaptor subunit [Porphyromonadaceae bacterium]